MMRMTLKQCSYFLAVADQGGIAQAARSLNISQPAVAQALDKLEALYGFKLLLRLHARGAELTPQGRAFYASARALLQQATRCEGEARAIAADRVGTLRFACFHTIAPFYLARIVMAHRQRHPDVEVRAEELLQDEIVSRLEDGGLDLAVTYDMGLESSSLERIQLADLTPYVLLSAAHPLAGCTSLCLAELASEPFVLFEGPASRDYFADVLAAQGIAPPVAHAARTMESVRCAVASGLGFSLSVMRPGPAETYDGGQVVYIPLTDTRPEEANQDKANRGKASQPKSTLPGIRIVLLRKAQQPVPSSLIADFMASCQTAFATTRGTT